MSGERTEAATPRRQQQLRSEGRAPRSQDLVAAGSLLLGFVVLRMTAQQLATNVGGLMTLDFSNLASVSRTASATDDVWAGAVLGNAGHAAVLAAAPILLALPLLSIVLGLAQGPVFAPKAIWRGFGALNPLSGFKRMLSVRSLVDLGRSFGKLLLVGWTTFMAFKQSYDQLPHILGSSDARVIAGSLADAASGVATAGAEALLVLAIADYGYQRWSFIRDSRMTKEEVKEEHKQQEGNPLVRAQMRARARRLAARRRQMEAVPTATVVVTNPTHFAVALKYDATMRSPQVVAKGADLLAQKIKEIAAAAAVPIIENRPLARGLFQAVEVGDEIPVELYEAVAEVLAYIFKLRQRRARRTT